MKVLTLLFTTITAIFLLVNCKTNQKIVQEKDCLPTKNCVVNIFVSDTNLVISEVVPFMGIADLSNAGNGADTDIYGNATINILRPANNIAQFEFRYLSLKDTFSVHLKKCEEQTNTSYYLPKRLKDSLRNSSSPKEIHYTPHGKSYTK